VFSVAEDCNLLKINMDATIYYISISGNSISRRSTVRKAEATTERGLRKCF